MPRRRLWTCSRKPGSAAHSSAERAISSSATHRPDKEGWTIAIAPLEPGKPGAALPPLLLANAAVSTAGDAERFVIIDGHRYSHIINPKTGQAVEDRASVTVVAPDGGTADALETTVYILGPERGLKLVEETPGAAAIYVRLDARRDQDVRVVAIQADSKGGVEGSAATEHEQPEMIINL